MGNDITVEFSGRPLPAVNVLRFRRQVGELPHLLLSIDLDRPADIGGGVVELDEQTRALLTKLGWTPPGEDS
ncbi:hypothetical protein M8C13_04495 [Crossiella sp. SN42]|uniref:hypothetical protein n=1 Tax=Crossiella sp. SN42 TaxID=2944808 RepID=UPI00207D3396|nr:hypothetical protein [Crossiella sp. SN42]MCO1575018.1 hypothetical protein [Crossiella sp. SN42]